MTLAPDHLGYTRPGEVDDPAPRVSVIPTRKWRHLTEPPEDAPALDNLPLARDIIHAHLWAGANNGDPWELTWAAIVIDLGDTGAIPHHEARDYIEAYHHWATLNGGPDWTPGDADELHTDTTRRLHRAGYTERNQA